MRAEEIGPEETKVSLARHEVARIGELALENNDYDLAVSFKGLGDVMDSMVAVEQIDNQLQLDLDAPHPDQSEAPAVTRRERATAALLLGVKRIRGVRRPKEHRKPEYTYGSDL